MAIRLWFTTDDLARTRVASPDPLAETLFSVITLSRGPMAQWRRRTRERLAPGVRPVASLLPGRPMLDLSSVAGRTRDLQEGLDSLLRRPAALTAEVEYSADSHGGVPAPLRHLLQVERGAPRILARTLATYHDVAVRPYWPRLRSHLEFERERAGRMVVDGGVEELFAALPGPHLRWESPVLTVQTGLADLSTDRDYELGGRGLLLAPSVFFGPHPAEVRCATP